MNLKAIIEGTDTRAGQVFDLAIQVMIVTSVVSYSIETLPGLSSGAIALLSAIETGTIAVFTAEYIARVYVASRKQLLRHCRFDGDRTILSVDGP